MEFKNNIKNKNKHNSNTKKPLAFLRHLFQWYFESLKNIFDLVSSSIKTEKRKDLFFMLSMASSLQGLSTLPRKNMNLPYYIRMHWTNFWQPTVCVQQNIFEKLWLKLVVHIYTLLLAPFAFKLVNCLRHNETYERDLSFFKHTSKTHWDSNNWPIWPQKIPKEA